MGESIFDGIQLLAKLSRYATDDEKLRLDSPPAARFREIIDKWVEADSAEARQKTRTDLLKPSTSLGTFHELLLREILRRKFGAVDREPEALPVGLAKPDFRVHSERRRRPIVFESASIAEVVDERTRKRRAIMRRLDLIPGPWHLAPEWSWSHDIESVSPKRVELAVRSSIAGLPPAQHHLDIAIDGSVFRATLLPASKHRASIVSVDSSGGMVTNPGVGSIRDDIKAKTKRYRGLKEAGIPFIVSIGVDRPLIDRDAMFAAMYGDEQVTLNFQEDEVTAIDEGKLSYSGKITPSPKEQARHRTLSAAWVVRWLILSGEMYAEVVHFPNPWAANPVRVLGHDISRITFRWVGASRVELRKPRRLRRLKIS